MSIFRGLFFVILISLAFIFNGCGGGGGSDSNTTVISVSLPVSTTEITSNNQIVDIEVRVFDESNSVYTAGDVKIIYPDDSVLGRDVGSFASSSVAVSEGIANFIYTAPNDISADTSDIVFTFYHEDNPNTIKTYTITINPDQAILTNYSLKSSDENDTIDLESSKLMTFSVTDGDDILVDDSKMISIEITSLNPNKGTLEDSLGSTGNSLTVTGKNSVAMNINSKTESGIIPLKAEASFFDANSNIQRLTKTFNVLVLSGPPSAISLSYKSSRQEEARVKFIEESPV